MLCNVPCKVLFLLLLAVTIDAIGILSFALPFLGEFADVLWAPVSGWLIATFFEDTTLARLGLLEELLPGTDLLPTASIAWARQYARFIPEWVGGFIQFWN